MQRRGAALPLFVKFNCGATQARNRLMTPGWAKSFLRGAQIFVLCPVVLNYVQHIFPRRLKNFLGGASLPPGYGPSATAPDTE